MMTENDIDVFQKMFEREYRIPVSGELTEYDAKFNQTLMQVIEACIKLKLYCVSNRKE